MLSKRPEQPCTASEEISTAFNVRCDLTSKTLRPLLDWLGEDVLHPVHVRDMSLQKAELRRLPVMASSASPETTSVLRSGQRLAAAET